MSEAATSYCALGDVADTNVETLPANTPPSARFRYIDLSAVEAGFINWGAVTETKFGAAPSRARRVVKGLDVLYGTVRPNLKSHGFIGSDEPGPLIASTGFSVVCGRDGVSHPGYLFHSLMSDHVTAQAVRAAIGSSYPALNDSDVRRLRIFLPSYGEQQRISQFLDTLDTAIHETEAIIAKLEAVKQGLLHDLLTRGIDANGELRPPQAEAPHLYKESPLGWIPKEWNVTTLRDTALRSRDSFTDGDWIETPFITSEGIRLIQTGNIGVGEFLDKPDSRRFIAPASFRMLNCKLVKSGDILICRLADPIGRACIVPDHVGPAITSVDCTIFRVDQENFSAEFVLAWVNADASLKRAQDNAAGSTRSRISRSNLGMLPIAKPALSEQQLVAGALQASAKRIADEQANLSKLKETKAGLMDDLLTGRVRVTPLLEPAAP